jgi:hypothetical protein
MLRAIWRIPVIHYQLVNIPVNLLRLIEGADLKPVGRLSGQQSLGADVYLSDRKVFHVHFDASDRKWQMRGLPVADCQLLLSWDIQPTD